MKIILRFIKLVVIGVSIIMATGVPSMNVYDRLSPNHDFSEKLSGYGDYFVISTGGAYGQGQWLQRTYMLVPKKRAMPTALIIDRSENGSLYSSTDKFAFWLVFGFFILGWYNIYRFSIGVKNGRSDKT